jgi:stage III sporulation protein AH
MFIVKKRAELLRFGAFLVIMGAMAYFVASRMQTWLASRTDPSLTNPPRLTQPAATSPFTGGTGAPHLIEQAPAVPDGSNFFADFRMERERNRAGLQEMLQSLMDNASTSAATRQQAGDQYMAAGRTAALEDRAEQMVKAKGFEDVVVNLAESGAQVVVKAKSINQQQAMQVVDMVSRITGVKPGAIQVMNRER